MLHVSIPLKNDCLHVGDGTFIVISDPKGLWSNPLHLWDSYSTSSIPLLDSDRWWIEELNLTLRVLG